MPPKRDSNYLSINAPSTLKKPKLNNPSPIESYPNNSIMSYLQSVPRTSIIFDENSRNKNNKNLKNNSKKNKNKNNNNNNNNNADR
jgi:hypothetical protein